MLKASKRALIVISMGVFLFWLLIKAPWDHNASTNPMVSLSGSTMGTSWNVQLNSDSTELELEQLADVIETLLFRLDKLIFSTYVPDSELSLLNQAPINKPVPISNDMKRVLMAAQEIYAASMGSFDITVAPLVNLWGFGPLAIDSAQWPSEKALADARSMVDMTALVIDPEDNVFLKLKPVLLDLSAIAKGYAVDELAELLLANEYANFLVEIGGELRVQGLRADNKPWRIAIELPSTSEQGVSSAINSQGDTLALAGSGDYRNFRKLGDTRYSHEIDPRTGYPIGHNLAAVTVISSSAMQADAWATAMMILGAEEGIALANRLKLSVYFIMRDEQGFITSHTDNFTEYLEPKESFPD